MKTILLLLAFWSVTSTLSAQLKVKNNHGINMTVGVQYTSPGGCDPTGFEEVITLAPTDSYLFAIPAGMEVLRVGVYTGSDSGWDYAACKTCGAGPLGIFIYTWASCMELFIS